jgi:hypothetical protein
MGLFGRYHAFDLIEENPHVRITHHLKFSFLESIQYSFL